ncbi:unnamed protein product, partial [marine sediment metagenome]
MKISDGLHVNLLGVIKNPSSIPKNVRHLESIYVTRNRSLAYVTFQIASDGYCTPPTTELAEKNMDYFLIEVVNTYKGAKIAVKKEGKEKNVWVDQKGIQRARINGSGQIIRVNNRGHVEIYYISSPTENDKKKIKYLVRFEDDLNFILRNPQLLQKRIEDDKTETLKEHEEEIKKLHKSVTEERLEKKANLSQAQA